MFQPLRRLSYPTPYRWSVPAPEWRRSGEILARRTSLGVERGRFDVSTAALDTAPTRRRAPDVAMDFDDAVSRLPDGARQVFVLHDVEGYKHDEIADMLGIVPGTSKSQLHHARMALRRHLDR